MILRRRICLLGLSLLLILATAGSAKASISITDFAGRQASFAAPPTRVVSLVPEVSEDIYALGAGSAVKGTTIFFSPPAGNTPPALVGGFFSPDLKAILKLKPQVVITGRFHAKLEDKLRAQGITPLRLQARRLDDLYPRLELLGKLFNKPEQARRLSQKARSQMKLVADKMAVLPAKAHRRVTRIMGADPKGGFIYIPGDDSFQNQVVASAGGIPPKVGKKGGSVKLTLAEWKALNPQAAYYCGQGKAIKKLLAQPGWREVEAVQKKRLYKMPCELTCRTSVHSGYFAQWLAALIYSDYFGKKKYQVLPWKVVGQKPLDIKLSYVKRAEVVSEVIQDFVHKTLVIGFAQPQTILSTLEGQRDGVATVGNHYLPPPSWRLDIHGGLVQLRQRVMGVLGLEPSQSSLLYTGANMDYLAVKRASQGKRTAYALVTAGARGNALRLVEEGAGHLDPGTINILVLTNHQLSPRAMARAVISATQAKTAALEDLDLRSSYKPLKYAATGTGTDNILVAAGQGPAEDLTGGHSVMGGLIARAVYAGVLEAVDKQNRLRPGRSVFERLREREVSLHALCGKNGVSVGRLETALLQPANAALVEAAFSLSDAAARDQLQDVAAFGAWCQEAAQRIAGSRPLAPPYKLGGPPLPRPLAMALGAILQGLASQAQGGVKISAGECG